MKKEGKNIAKAHAGVEKRPYTLQDAVPLLQKVKFAKFDETVEITLRLGVDPKHADQMAVSYTHLTLSDQRIRLLTLLILALFAFKSWVRRKDVMHPDGDGESK